MISPIRHDFLVQRPALVALSLGFCRPCPWFLLIPSLERRKTQMKLKVLLIFRKFVRILRKEFCDVSAVAEARFHIERAIRPFAPGTPLKVLFPRVARLLGVTPRRVETLWLGTARRVDSDEMDRLRNLVRVQPIEDFHATGFERDAARLEALDADFYGPEIARLRGLAVRAGNLSARTGG